MQCQEPEKYKKNIDEESLKKVIKKMIIPQQDSLTF